MTIRLLFLNTADRYGADVAVHLSLMKNFATSEAEIFVLSNSEAADAEQMRAVFAALTHVTTTFMPLGRPAEALAARGKVGKALAYGPSAASLLRAVAFIRRNRIQIIHATDRPRDASFASLLGSLTGVAAVVHMHSNVGAHLSGPALWGMRKARAVLGVSDFISRELAGVGLDKDKICTVHNAVDAAHFDPDISQGVDPSVRQQFGVPREAPLVGIAARMTDWKGHRELIGAVAQLQSTFPDLHVLILGTDVPAFREDIIQRARKSGIAERVHFGGYQSDVRPFLKEMDVFVHPSYAEPFGLSIAEAMAMRKPVIACNSGGVPEIITQGADGILVEPRSAEAVAAALQKLLPFPESRQMLGTRARETIRSRFSPRRQCEVLSSHYSRMLTAA